MIKVLNLTRYSCEKISKKILIDKEFVKLPRTYYSLCKPRDPEDRARYMSSFDYMNDIAVFIQDIIQASPDVIIAPHIAGETTYSVMDIFYSFELKFIYSKYAKACAVSIAGIIPSNCVNNKPAFSDSSSVIETY